MNLIRIYGVGRSGSTVIGAYLAGHIKNAVHIGEAVRFDSPDLIEANPTCTCGSSITDCPVWKPVDRSNYRSVIESLYRRGHPEIEFLMVGDGPGRVGVQESASNNMRFTGMVDYAELPSLYASSDAAIVIYEFERHKNVELSSIKTLEYLASRLPVFSTDVSGQEIIKKNSFGYLVREGESVTKGFDHFLTQYSEYLESLHHADDLENEIGWKRTAIETMKVIA